VGLGLAISLTGLALQDAELSRAPRVRELLVLSAARWSKTSAAGN